MTHRISWLFLLSLFVSIACAARAQAAEVDVLALVRTIRNVGPKGQGHQAASRAWKELSKADASQLGTILTEMKGAGPLASNWLRAAVDSIVDRERRAKRPLPVKSLESFLADSKQGPHARRTAYEVLLQVDPGTEAKWIPRMLNDNSLELRRDAVLKTLRAAGAQLQAGDKEQAQRLYQQAFEASRDVDQIKESSEQLKKLGKEVDVAKHYGFIMHWNLIGPFDNTDKSGFDVAYPPETKIDLTASYPGKNGPVRWRSFTTDDKLGIVDLNKALDKHKGAICYAYAEFDSKENRELDIRLACINGNKIWLNGKLLTRNHVYHASVEIDQYVSRGQIRRGLNTLLVKVAQNEQSENWAQRWQFQLRVCDQIGTAVHSSK